MRLLKKSKSTPERRARIRNNPKIGKIVVNRQRDYYGALLTQGKITPYLVAKCLSQPKFQINWMPERIVINRIRIM